MTNFSPGRMAALNAATGHLILVVAFLGIVHGTKLQFHTTLPQALIDASTYALTTLLIAWLMLGEGPLTSRIKETACGLLALGLLHRLALRHDVFGSLSPLGPTLDAAMLFLAPLAGLLIAGWLARRAGWRWRPEEEAREAPPFQFSLREVFAAVIVAACLLGLDRAMSYHAILGPREWSTTGRGALIAQLLLCNAGLVFVVGSRVLTVAAMSGRTPRLIGLVAVVATMYLGGLFGMTALGDSPYNARRAARTAANGGLLTMLHLLSFRAAGFRIDRAAPAPVAPLDACNETEPVDEPYPATRRMATRRRFDKTVRRLKRRLSRRAGAVAMEQRTRRRGRKRVG